MDNTPGVKDIKPRVLGMRGKKVNLGAIEARDRLGGMTLKRGKRVDLGDVATIAEYHSVPITQDHSTAENPDFIRLDAGDDQDHKAVNLNRKLRLKWHRALEHAQVRKEMLVRRFAIEHLKATGRGVPIELKTKSRAVNIRGVRILENGAKETAKQERLHKRTELKRFNEASRVLRKQAKNHAVEAGLRKHAEVTGQLPSSDRTTENGGLPMPAHILASAGETALVAASGNDRRDSGLEGSSSLSEESSVETQDDSEELSTMTSMSSIEAGPKRSKALKRRRKAEG